MSTSYSDFDGRTVLVTGGTGTIGSAVVRRLLQTEAVGIRVYSRDESKQFELMQRLPDDDRLRFLIGDTRDLDRLRRAVEGVSVVFHAAAMKHVYSCEYNPFEAVKTNIVGTQNVIDASIDANVERVLFASSDKAVNPTSTMGASKLMAEKLISAANAHRGPRSCVFASVRFGNVIGSRGSVLPLFLEQIAAGGPVTITDRRMTRFMMSVEHAVGLMFGALDLAVGGEVFVLKMPALRIEDLAELLVDHALARRGPQPSEIEIREVGSGAGEKQAEELLTAEELQRCLETDELYIIVPQVLSAYPQRDYAYSGAGAATSAAARSDEIEPMSRDELLRVLIEADVLQPA